MSVTNTNAAPASESESFSESSTPQTNLGWEGHVHFQEETPLWERLLETYPEVRTGVSYGLIFTSGILLGAAIMAMATVGKSQSHHAK
ncbi:MAG: hypothetical protein KC563_00905 [Nitrospira sp.]|nr:hypothetical protein [Nitrospira sp.]MCB9711276.1 hypothetical protein [Nitrospiraceae bacterium]MDR4486409.1 hypothetical protein [Nitrospirales bacterium]MCA9465407.1 hypothetical protein [Nitrospira sp.]MCA9474359.1 hypothetical protein [Nitrospira sp.]